MLGTPPRLTLRAGGRGGRFPGSSSVRRRASRRRSGPLLAHLPLSAIVGPNRRGDIPILFGPKVAVGPRKGIVPARRWGREGSLPEDGATRRAGTAEQRAA